MKMEMKEGQGRREEMKPEGTYVRTVMPPVKGSNVVGF